MVFAYCWDDDWIISIGRALYLAAQELGHELFIIAAGDQDGIDKKHFINLEYVESTWPLSKRIELLHYDDVDLTDLIHVDYTFSPLLYGRKDETKEEVRERLYRWFSEAIVLLKMIQPDLVIVWNGLLSKRALYAEAARYLHIPLYYAEKGLLPHSWYIDPQGINALSTIASAEVGLPIREEEIAKWKSKLRMIDRSGESAWDQPGRKDLENLRRSLGISPNRRVVFFPGQVDSDSNIVFFSPHFKRTLDALRWLIEGLPQDTYYVLAKPHPKGLLTAKDFEDVIGDKGKAFAEINVIDAIELADCVVTINSTVGFEAAIRAKPVLLLGKSVLSAKDFVSCYVPGKEAKVQLDDCIRHYIQKIQYFHLRALSFAMYLDTYYYTYRGDYEGTRTFIQRLSNVHTQFLEKQLTDDEIAAFFQEIPQEDEERLSTHYLRCAWNYYHLGDMYNFRRCVKKTFQFSFPHIPWRLSIPFLKSYLGRSVSERIHTIRKRLVE